jgi:ribonuclease VapC
MRKPVKSSDHANMFYNEKRFAPCGDAVAQREFDRFFERSGIGMEPVTLEQARIAREAYREFGKGRHRTGLNFGDCFACA